MAIAIDLNDIAACFRKQFGNNGEVRLGLGDPMDGKNPVNKTIPVPHNISLATTISHKYETACWAYQVQLHDNPGQTILAEMAFYAYMLDLVRVFVVGDQGQRWYQNKANYNTAALLNGLDWASEIRVINADIAQDVAAQTAAVPLPAYGAAFVIPEECREIIEKGADYANDWAMLFTAGKITWYTTKHHLGSRVLRGDHPLGRTTYGFLEKFLRIIRDSRGDHHTFTALDITVPNNKVLLHEVLHPVSAHGVLRKVGPANCITALRMTRSIICAASGDSINEVRWTPMEQVTIRAAQFGAGARVVEDVLSAFKKILATALYPVMPGRQQVGALRDIYLAARGNIYSYGDHSRYLCGANVHNEINPDGFATLTAACKTYVQLCERDSSLGMSAIMSAPWQDDENRNNAWGVLCNAYTQKIRRGFGDTNQVLELLGQHTGIGGVDEVGGPENDAIIALGLISRRDDWNAAIVAVKARQPPQPDNAPNDGGQGNNANQNGGS